MPDPALSDRLSALPGLLEQLTKESGNPGISVGVMSGDETAFFVHGLAHVEHGTPVHPETVFQIGSNTKLWTSTVVMRLVDEGLVSLDEPVSSYVPEFRLAGADAADVKVRHLLTHTGGFLGDYFGTDATETVADFVGELAGVEQLHPVGAMWSYCNSGFVLLGRLIEKVTGLPYAAALKAKLLDPLGAAHTRVRCSDIIPLRVAMGYLPDPATGGLSLAPYGLMPSSAPAGSTPVSDTADMLAFIRMHLDGGTAADGTRVLESSTVELMQTKQVDLPAANGRAAGWGLGWSLHTTADGQRVIGHGGGTPSGFVSLLEVVPDRRVAVVVLTNSPLGAALLGKVADQVLTELVGSPLNPPPPEPPDPPVKLDWSRYAGTYASGGGSFEVSAAESHEGLTVLTRSPDIGAMTPPPQTIPLVALDESRFVPPVPGATTVMQFLDFDDAGRPRYFFAGRLFPRRD